MLDDRYKNTMYLVKIEELTYQETAQILGKSIQNGIKQKFNENSQLIDRIDWNDSNGYVLYAMLKKELNFI